jgi:glycine oxidase
MREPSGKRLTNSPEITIVGGGIIGCALAYRLSCQGITTQIFERRELAREASWASAGIISPPAPRHLARAELALRSYHQYPGLIREVEQASGISCGYVATGAIEVGNDEDRQLLEQTLAWQRANGMQVELLDGRALHGAEPALHPRFTFGLYASGAGSVLLDRLAAAFARAAQLRGALVREHMPVSRIVIDGSSATAVETFDGQHRTGGVIITAGAWSRALGESIDFAIPTVPVRGQMMAIADPPVQIRAVIAGGGGYLVPRADGTVAVGATEEHDSGFDTRVTPAGVVKLTEIVERAAPSLVHGRLIATWAGLRPGTTHGEPVIGRVPHLDNVWIATGHFRSGALLAPATADALATSISSGELDPMLAPFDPAMLR